MNIKHKIILCFFIFILFYFIFLFLRVTKCYLLLLLLFYFVLIARAIVVRKVALMVDILIVFLGVILWRIAHV